jgi:glycosyltransferase involved in cell wall biosynthesis
MRVSLYIPCFNAGKTIKECLDAVLRQTYPISEIIIIDDGSNDATVDIVSAYPVKLIRHECNRGLAAVRNTAIQAASGDWVAAIDSDCVVSAHWLEYLVRHFIDSNIVGAGGKVIERYTKTPCDFWRSVHLKQHWGDSQTRPNFLYGANSLFRKDALLAVNGYNDKFKTNYEDVYLCERLKTKGFSFIYDSQAQVEHIRRDNLYSLMNTYWRWNQEYYCRKGFYLNEDSFSSKIKDNIGLANRYIEEDILSGNQSLVYLDFLLALHHSLKDLEYFSFAEIDKKGAAALTILWLSLLDLTFFYHFMAADKDLSTFLPERNAYSQNIIALQLVLGRFIRDIFADEKILNIFYHDLLFALYGINDDCFDERLAALLRNKHDWSNFCRQKHCYLNQAFLNTISREFSQWLEQLNYGNKAIPMIIDSANAVNLKHS